MNENDWIELTDNDDGEPVLIRKESVHLIVSARDPDNDKSRKITLIYTCLTGEGMLGTTTPYQRYAVREPYRIVKAKLFGREMNVL